MRVGWRRQRWRWRAEADQRAPGPVQVHACAPAITFAGQEHGFDTSNRQGEIMHTHSSIQKKKKKESQSSKRCASASRCPSELRVQTGLSRLLGRDLEAEQGPSQTVAIRRCAIQPQNQNPIRGPVDGVKLHQRERFCSVPLSFCPSLSLLCSAHIT